MDVVSFLSLGRVFTANMTGSIVLLAFATAHVCGLLVFIGGIGLLISMLALAVPPGLLIGFTALELLGAPALIWRRTQVTARSGSTSL